jgi:hypothetical protein
MPQVDDCVFRFHYDSDFFVIYQNSVGWPQRNCFYQGNMLFGTAARSSTVPALQNSEEMDPMPCQVKDLKKT